jgi:hypothetical protein
MLFGKFNSDLYSSDITATLHEAWVRPLSFLQEWLILQKICWQITRK